MNLFQSLTLGIVQGLTEFLPVSSSGHLVLVQKILPGFTQPGITFDVILHFGTLFAVLIYFWKNLFHLPSKYYLYIVVGTIPAVLAGFFLRDVFENMFKYGGLLWLQFFVSGAINLMVDPPQKKTNSLNATNSFIIGISQAISIIPAISRSGATIFTGVRLGIKREDVAQFSFLLSIPAILGANVLEIVSHREEIGNVISVNYIAGFFAALIVGIISIKLVYKLLERRAFKYFGYYCFVVGIVSFFVM